MIIFFGLLLIDTGLTQQICHGAADIPAIAGNWIDNYGYIHIINQQIWNNSGYISHLCFVQNTEKDLYAQNDGDWLYSRFEWTYDNSNNLWYCQQVYDAHSLEEAEEVPRANPSNPSVNGCGLPHPPDNKTFPWSKLTRLAPRPHPRYGRGLETNQTCFGSPLNIPDISGRYTDNYGGFQIVNEWLWNSSGLIFNLCSVDNNDALLYAQNDGRNPYNQWKYSRFQWTFDLPSKSLWYCQQVYDAPNLQLAESAPSADPSNPKQGGCGVPANNFPWTQMIKINPKQLKHQPGQTCHGGKEKPAIAGRYNDNYGGTQVVTKKSWRSEGALFHICSTHNDKKDIIAQNDRHNAGNSLKYSRFEWVTVENSHTLWYCQQVYNADTVQQAESAPRADGSNPSVGGCGIPSHNFPWTQMIKVSASQPSSKAAGKKCSSNYLTPLCQNKEDL